MRTPKSATPYHGTPYPPQPQPARTGWRAAAAAQPKKRRKSANGESAMQISCVTWFRYQFPRLLLYAVPNGGQRSKTTGAILKAEGVLAGWPDLNLDCARGGYFGFRAEAKRPDGKGVVSDKQTALHPQITAAGYYVCIFETLDDFKRHVLAYLRMPATVAVR